MSYSGDAAEQVVRMTLEGAEVAAKVTGAGAKQVAVLLYAILRDQKKTKGKTRLASMLRSGKELKVFAVRDTDLQRFCTEAKKYGVLYCVLKDRAAEDGITDIMVRAEDAGKINRIFERFDLATVDLASVKEEIRRGREERTGEAAPAEGHVPVQDKKEAFPDALLGQPQGASAAAHDREENPMPARGERSHPSAPTSVPKDPAGRDTSDAGTAHARRSVRQELREIQNQRREPEVRDKAWQAPQRSGPHQAPQKKKSNKGKGR